MAKLTLDSNDICRLFRVTELADLQDINAEFLNVWLKRSLSKGGRGLRLPSRDEDPGAYDDVPFRVHANLCHAFGKPIGNGDKPAGSGKFEASLKLPKRVCAKMESDDGFRSQMLASLYQAQKPDMLDMLSDRNYDVCLSCATQKAIGFVQSMTVSFNDGVSLILLVAFPVCGDMACNAELRKERDRAMTRGRPNNAPFGRERCSMCKIYEDRNGDKLMACGRCKVIYYCSKECQIKDWPRHRPECKDYRKKKATNPA